MTPPSAVTSLIPQTGRLQPLSSPQALTKSQAGKTMGTRLSILTNLMLSLSLSERTVWQTLPSTFLTSHLRKFSHSFFWVSQSAIIFLGQTSFQSWPPKPATNWPSSIIKSPSLTHLNSDPSPRLSSTAGWSSGLPSELAPLPHIFLRSMLCKPRPSRLLESPPIADSSVMSLSFTTSFLVLHPLFLNALPPLQISAGPTWSSINHFRGNYQNPG